MTQKWTIIFTPKAEKEFSKLAHDTQQQIFKTLEKVERNPDQYLKVLHGPFAGFYKLRVGKYRLICKKEKTELIILILKIGKRDKIYN